MKHRIDIQEIENYTKKVEMYKKDYEIIIDDINTRLDNLAKSCELNKKTSIQNINNQMSKNFYKLDKFYLEDVDLLNSRLNDYRLGVNKATQQFEEATVEIKKEG